MNPHFVFRMMSYVTYYIHVQWYSIEEVCVLVMIGGDGFV